MNLFLTIMMFFAIFIPTTVMANAFINSLFKEDDDHLRKEVYKLAKEFTDEKKTHDNNLEIDGEAVKDYNKKRKELLATMFPNTYDKNEPKKREYE